MIRNITTALIATVSATVIVFALPLEVYATVVTVSRADCEAMDGKVISDARKVKKPTDIVRCKV